MSSLTAYDALRDWFDSNWTFTARRHENEDPNPPADLSPFVHFATAGDLYQQLSIGAGSPSANLWRERGLAIFTCCVATGIGVSIARGYAVTLAQMMRGLALPPGLQCEAMRIPAGAAFGRGGSYWGVPLVTEWYRDEPAAA